MHTNFVTSMLKADRKLKYYHSYIKTLSFFFESVSQFRGEAGTDIN